MKNKNKKIKLSLNKIQIAKINETQLIYGGATQRTCLFVTTEHRTCNTQSGDLICTTLNSIE